MRVDRSSPDQDLLSVQEVTGGQYQYFDSPSSTQYYNPLGGNGTFTVTAAPRDVQNSIALVGENSAQDNTAGPITITNPSTAAGQVEVAQISYEQGTSATIVPPAGWTLLGTQNVSTFWGEKVYYRVTANGDPTTYTWSNSASANANLVGGITAWSGVSTSYPIDAWGSQQQTSATITSPSVTAAADCDELVTLSGIWSSENTITPPPGMTEAYFIRSQEVGWDPHAEAAYQVLGAIGATGTRAATMVGSGAASQGDKSNAGFNVALRPNVCVSQVDFPAPGQTGFTGGEQQRHDVRRTSRRPTRSTTRTRPSRARRTWSRTTRPATPSSTRRSRSSAT